MEPPGSTARLPEAILQARCGAMRDASAKLREQARVACEASALLRRLTQRRPRTATGARGDTPPAARAIVVLCRVCGGRVSSHDLSLAVGRPTHAACYESHLRTFEGPIRELLQNPAESWCRACVAEQLGVPIELVNSISGRLIAQRSVRTGAGTCRRCRRPRLVLATLSAGAV